jgi:dsDNA-binding SOS-regulon protein
MAVITRYVVVRNGVELDQVFSVKKEAEAYDKMLDAAEHLADFIKSGELEVDLAPATIDAIAVLLAKNGPEVVKILKGVKPVFPPSEAASQSAAQAAPPARETKGTKTGSKQRKK